LRRSPRSQTGKLRIGALELDIERSQVRCGEMRIGLTSRELHLLRVLAQEAGRIVSRRRLLQEVWDMNNSELVETRTVDINTLLLQNVLERPAFCGEHGPDERRVLSPLFWTLINPYGRFQLDMDVRLDFTATCLAALSRRPASAATWEFSNEFINQARMRPALAYLAARYSFGRQDDWTATGP
jgi:hypothetical protein